MEPARSSLLRSCMLSHAMASPYSFRAGFSNTGCRPGLQNKAGTVIHPAQLVAMTHDNLAVLLQYTSLGGKRVCNLGFRCHCWGQRRLFMTALCLACCCCEETSPCINVTGRKLAGKGVCNLGIKRRCREKCDVTGGRLAGKGVCNLGTGRHCRRLCDGPHTLLAPACQHAVAAPGGSQTARQVISADCLLRLNVSVSHHHSHCLMTTRLCIQFHRRSRFVLSLQCQL